MPAAACRRWLRLLSCRSRSQTGRGRPQKVGGGSAPEESDPTVVRTRTAQPTGTISRGGGCGAAMTLVGGGNAATSSARRPSLRISGVPHFLHVIRVPSSLHFQHVGQQTLMTTAHSCQGSRRGDALRPDSATAVTGSAQISERVWQPLRGRTRDSAVTSLSGEGAQLCRRSWPAPRCPRRRIASMRTFRTALAVTPGDA
jgi:hypothetical protein